MLKCQNASVNLKGFWWGYGVFVCGAVPHGGGHDRVGETGEWERGEGARGSSDPAGARRSGAGDSPKQVRAVLTQTGHHTEEEEQERRKSSTTFISRRFQPLDDSSCLCTSVEFWFLVGGKVFEEWKVTD